MMGIEQRTLSENTFLAPSLDYVTWFTLMGRT